MKTKQNIAPRSKTKQGGKPKKKCSTCHKPKPLKEFNKDKGTKDGYSYICRPCRIKAQRKAKKEYLRKVDALKAKVSCAKCGETRTYTLDYHHNVPADKIDTISNMRDNRVSMDKIKAEIEKCTIVCSNCHREIHHRNLTIEQFLKEK